MATVPDAPRIPGLSFRPFKDPSDYGLMVSLARRSSEADHDDYFEVAEDVANEYRDSPDRNPCSEMLFAEVAGEPVGFARIWTEPGRGGLTEFWQVAHVLQEWRGTGLRRALVRYNENHITELLGQRSQGTSDLCRTWALDEPNDWRDLIVSQGYAPSMLFFEMVRPNLDDLPDAKLPEGVEIRPVKPDDYLKIWEASREAFRGKPWFVEEYYDKKYYQQWLKSSNFQPELWKVAWSGDEVAGNARNDSQSDLNLAYGRKRGFTQHLSVSPKWRRKGLGKALLAESLKMMREMGFEEAALVVETQSTTGELGLYLDMGYQIHRRFAHFAKSLSLSGSR